MGIIANYPLLPALDSTRFWICVFGHFDQMHCPIKPNKAISLRYICIIPGLMFLLMPKVSTFVPLPSYEL